MAHVRRQIREAVKTRLAGRTPAGANVFENRLLRIPEGKLPAITIGTADERSERSQWDECGHVLARTVEVVVELHVQHSEAEDRLDAIAVDVERALAEDETLGGLVQELQLVRTTDAYTATGERLAGVKRLFFEATYQTAAADPETAL